MADLKAVPDLPPEPEFRPLQIRVFRRSDILKASDALMYWAVAENRAEGVIEVADCPLSTVKEALSVEGVYDYDVTALGEMRRDA